MLGFYGLLYEITNPGLGIGGVAGAVLLILGLYAMHMLPINYAGLLLITLAIILFVAEAKVASHGLLTLGGLVCMFLGSLMLFRAPAPFIGLSLSMIIPVTLGTAFVVIFLVSLVLRSQMRKAHTGREGMLGLVGVAETDLVPAGQIFVRGEIWSAVAEEQLSKGTKVKVVGIDGLTLHVKKEEEKT